MRFIDRNILICKKIKIFCHSLNDYVCMNSYAIIILKNALSKEFKGYFDFFI